MMAEQNLLLLMIDWLRKPNRIYYYARTSCLFKKI